MGLKDTKYDILNMSKRQIKDLNNIMKLLKKIYIIKIYAMNINKNLINLTYQ